MRYLAMTLLGAALALAGCGGDSPKSPGNAPTSAVWSIGPTIGGVNSSRGVPATVAATAGAFAFDIPQPTSAAGHVHYVTHAISPSELAGKTRVVMRGRIEAADDVQLVPYKGPSGGLCDRCGSPGMLTIYFATKDNDWSTDGRRWWASFATITPLKPGPFEIVAPLDANWSSVFTMTALANPEAFAKAKAKIGEIGFTLGGGDGLGHGAYATGPARFVVDSFSIE